MEKVILDYIGTPKIKSLRDFILDQKLTERDTIALHQKNFDDVVLEYRDTYHESLTNPYIMLGCVLIEEDRTQRVPIDRIGLIENDTRRPVQIRNKEDYVQSLMHSEEIIYRCGYCGNIVDDKGEELDNATFKHHSEILGVRKTKDFVKETYGFCCRERFR